MTTTIEAPAATLVNKLGAGEGFYMNNLGVFKIQKTQRGYLFAKKLNRETGDFEGAPGAVNRIRPETRMTLEQAAGYGKLYGRCIACGAKLTDEVSIAAGIGPICGARF